MFLSCRFIRLSLGGEHLPCVTEEGAESFVTVLLRGAVVNRTYGVHINYQYIFNHFY